MDPDQKTKDLRLTKIAHRFPENTLRDVQGAVRAELRDLDIIIKPGASVAIGVGSRGIDNLTLAVREVVQYIGEKNGNPFIFPAMGSHGGATAEGQAEILSGYGISEKNLGVPVRSSMEVVELSKEEGKPPVYMDKHAWESDGIFLINKIKPHTDFRSTYESGLVKMSVIGMGKERGAVAVHESGVTGLREWIPRSFDVILSTGKILAGLALVENAYDRTMLVKALPSSAFREEEPKLLSLARANRPYFPAERFDVLIVDEMGKNISGVGMDTHIIGRMKIAGQEEPITPQIRSIVVTSLTDESHGNATGIGLADIITRHLYNQVDWEITRKNIITSSFLERGKIPVIAESDTEAFDLALRNCGNPHPGRETIIRIKNTLQMNELMVSRPILEEIRGNPSVQILRENCRLFTTGGNLAPF